MRSSVDDCRRNLPISSSAGQHLVDADDVEGVEPYTQMEGILAAVLGQVLVGTDTASLQGLGGDLLPLIGHQMDAQGEVIHASLFATQVVDADLGVWDTPAETRLGVGLVFAVTITERKEQRVQISEVLICRDFWLTK